MPVELATFLRAGAARSSRPLPQTIEACILFTLGPRRSVLGIMPLHLEAGVHQSLQF